MDCSTPGYPILHCLLEFAQTHVSDRRRQWHSTPVLLPGKSHGRRSLVGSSPWGLWGSDTTSRLHFDFSLSCIGEGNGNPLRCSCLENPRDGGAWWAAVYGVAQSRIQLKQLSSSSSMSVMLSNHLILSYFLLLLPPVFPSSRFFCKVSLWNQSLRCFLTLEGISVFLSLVLSVNRLAHNLTCYPHKAISLHLIAYHQNHHYF